MPYSKYFSAALHSTGVLPTQSRCMAAVSPDDLFWARNTASYCFTCYFELNLMHCSLVDVLSLSLVIQGTLDETVHAGMMHAHVCLAANCQSPMGALATDKCALRGLLYLSIKPSAI
jgi:hypothetical protein